MFSGWIIILYLCLQFYCIHSLYSSFRGSCTLPRIANGRANVRQRGRLVRYQCNIGFSLIGGQYAGCIGGQWDSPIPMCVKRGCSEVERPNGKVFLFNDGTTANLFCSPGYEEAGARIAYCNGKEWDRSVGNCRETGVGPAYWCDFDTVNKCGWTTDPTHDFDWKQQNGGGRSSTMRSVRTGPQHDHTTMKELEGFYMVAESIGRNSNDLARLLSPIYPADKSVEACFRFFYHMYGRQLGRLRVYVKPVSLDLDEVLSDNRFVMFERSGVSENRWMEEIVSLTQHSEEFQIVLEASAGNSIFSDIAVDDVALLNGAECLNEEEQTTPQQEEEIGGVYDVQSCANRCSETRSALSAIVEEKILSGNGTGGVLVHCECFDGCEEKQLCCADYKRICVFDKSTDSNDEFGTTEEAIIITEPQRAPETTTKLTTVPTRPTTTTTAAPTIPSTKSTSPPTTKTTPKATTTKTTPKATTTKQSSLSTSKATLPPKKPTIASTISPNTTKATTLSTTSKTTSKPTIPATVFPPNSTISVQEVTKTPSTTTTTAESNKWIAPVDETNDIPYLMNATLALIFVIFVAVAFKYYQKYEKNQSGTRGTKEDVRYLIEEDNVDL